MVKKTASKKKPPVKTAKKSVKKPTRTTGKTPTIGEQTHYVKVGRLHKPIADAIGREAAYIYISQNNLRHIFLRHRTEIAELGFTPKAFVDLVVTGFNQIYKAQRDALFLIIQNGKSKVVVVEMNYSLKEGFYEVITASVMSKDFFKNKELLWKK